MRRQKIKVGIIGAGLMGPIHVEALRRLGFVEVVALCDSNQRRVEKEARRLGIPKTYLDYRKLLEDREVEVVHNCTPNFMHFEVNKAAMEAGKKVISEKPLAMNTSETKRLVEIAKETGSFNAVNFNYRYFPLNQHVKAMISKGELGRINIVQGCYLQDWLLYDTDYNWRLDPKIGGASFAVSDLGSHWLDLVQYITGLKITSIFADLDTIISVRKYPKRHEEALTFAKRKLKREDYVEKRIETEDYATLLLRFDNGARGVFTTSQLCPGRKCRIFYEIDGSKCAVSWNHEKANELWIGYRDEANKVLLRDPTLIHEEARPYAHYPGGHDEGWPDDIKNIFSNIYQFIREEKDVFKDEPNFPTFLDGHRMMVIVETALKSHREKRWVEIF